jgi:hypothetical protein
MLLTLQFLIQHVSTQSSPLRGVHSSVFYTALPFVLDIPHETPRSKPILKTRPCSYGHPLSSPVRPLPVLLEPLCTFLRDH